MKFELEKYTPHEASECSFLSQKAVWNYRDKGYLPRPEGHARYDVIEVLIMYFLGVLVKRGLAPAKAVHLAPDAANAAFFKMTRSMRSYPEDALEAAWLEVRGLPDGDDAERQVIETKGDSPVFERLSDRMHQMGIDIAYAARPMVKTIRHMQAKTADSFVPEVFRNADWMVIWADDSMDFLTQGEATETFFANIKMSDPNARGPIIVFSLAGIADTVLDRLPRKPIKLVS